MKCSNLIWIFWPYHLKWYEKHSRSNFEFMIQLFIMSLQRSKKNNVQRFDHDCSFSTTSISCFIIVSEKIPCLKIFETLPLALRTTTWYHGSFSSFHLVWYTQFFYGYWIPSIQVIWNDQRNYDCASSDTSHLHPSLKFEHGISAFTALPRFK